MRSDMTRQQRQYDQRRYTGLKCHPHFLPLVRTKTLKEFWYWSDIWLVWLEKFQPPNQRFLLTLVTKDSCRGHRVRSVAAFKASSTTVNRIISVTWISHILSQVGCNQGGNSIRGIWCDAIWLEVAIRKCQKTVTYVLKSFALSTHWGLLVCYHRGTSKVSHFQVS